ncbi:MAG: hypothetical protein AMK72_10460 [Planctomycetes bacterium SM23_25]|nr:MAG: hypothetical protein AMK72_10460 [Planctomycetes bacterium SM23_25]
MPKLVLTNGVAMLEFARRVTLGLLEDIPEDKLFYQPFPGANHALWIIEHVAWDDSFFLTALAVRCKTVAPDLRVRCARVHAVKTSDSEVRRYRSGAFEGFCTGLVGAE